jgi:hypothetical protein
MKRRPGRGLVEHVGDSAIAGDRGGEPFVCVAVSAMFQVVAAGFDVVELRDDDERGGHGRRLLSSWHGRDRIGPCCSSVEVHGPERGVPPAASESPLIQGSPVCYRTVGAVGERALLLSVRRPSGEDPDNPASSALDPTVPRGDVQ